MAKADRKRLRRRQAIEPTIGHLKADHGMRRTWLKGSLGDGLHVILCAAGFNLKWLMRAIALYLPITQVLGLIRLFIDTLKIDVLGRLRLNQSSQAKLMLV
jgi:hypothetical protein